MTSEVLALLVIAVLYNATPLTAESHYTNEWAAQIPGGEEQALRIAKRHGYEIVTSVQYFDNLYILRRNDVPHRSKRSSHQHTRRLIEDGKVLWAEQQIARSRVKRKAEFHVRNDGTADFNDPLFEDEWYIENSDPITREERGSIVHFDLRVKEAWAKGYTGQNVTVTVLDDGLEHNNTDIAANYDAYASTDLNGNDDDPMPRYDPTNENKHGTRCAGEIAMVANNGKCGVGIAFNSRIGGVRMLDGKVTDSVEARALSFNYTHVDIYSASWGPNDDGVTVEGPGTLASKALEKGIKHGRGGKGVIYAWASGNGGRMQDNCNCDGYTSSIYTLSVSSASERGRLPWYGEQCSSTFATTYSSGNGGDHQVVSSDLHNGCTTRHTGTSAAAPMAAGIFALLLEANPDLTWRDVQHLVAFTSKVGPLLEEGGWYQNAAGFCVNLGFGFGMLDAKQLVTTAHPDTWVNVPEQHTCEIGADAMSNLPQRLSSGHFAEVLIETNGCEGQDNEINFVEHVQLVLTLSYSKRGAISVTLVSPSGTNTSLMMTREWDKSKEGFKQWPLMSVHTWGEDPKGVWRLIVRDDTPNGSEHGQLEDVRLVLHGTKAAPHYLRNGPIRCDVSLTNTTVAASSSVNGFKHHAHAAAPADKVTNLARQSALLNNMLELILQDHRPAEDLAQREEEEEGPFLYL